MISDSSKFKNSIICSGIVIIALVIYCISEMIVSWCVRYSYYYANGRIVALISLFVIAIIFSTQHKKIGLLPLFVCSALFFAIGVDFLKIGGIGVFFAFTTDVNTLRIFPLIMHFEKYRDLSHPQNHWATKDDLDFFGITTFTIVFVVAILIGLIILIVAHKVKKSKLDVAKAIKALNTITLSMTLFLFVEFMRCLFVLTTTRN